MDLSNRFLAVLLIVAMLVSLGGTLYSIARLNLMSGFGTSGFVNVTISNWTNLNVTAVDCDFGSGAVNASYTYAILASNSTITNWNGTGETTNMSIQNDGNVNITVNVSSGKNTSTFLGGGTRQAYKIFAGNKDGVACTGIPTAALYPGIEINTSGNAQICSNLSPLDTADEMWVGCYLEIADNTPPGSKTDTWTFTAAAKY